MPTTDLTHDPQRRSFIESANASDADFPIQNLPLGVFRRKAEERSPRIGISNRNFGFDIIYEADGPVQPDPYLVRSERQKPAAPRLPQLRLVK